MSTVDCEAIMEALFDVLVATKRFRTIDRNLKLWDQVNEQPALFFNEVRERNHRSAPLAPPRLELMVDLFVYAKSDKDAKAPKAASINVLLDAIDAALVPSGADLVNRRQTLGGVVYNCYVDGQILKDSGHLDGQALAIVPLLIICP